MEKNTKSLSKVTRIKERIYLMFWKGNIRLRYEKKIERKEFGLKLGIWQGKAGLLLEKKLMPSRKSVYVSGVQALETGK